MSEIYPSVRLAIRDSVTRILFDRPGQWLTTAELLNYCEEAETSDTLAKILSDMAKTGRLVRGLKTLNAQGREVNTWGLAPKLRDKIMAGQLLAQSQDATEAPPLPVESREDEAPSPPLPVESREDDAPALPISQPTGTRQTSRPGVAITDYSALQPPFAWMLADPDQPPETPPANQAAATDIHYHPLPERWLPELRLRLLGYDGRDDPIITLRINTDGGGAFLTLSTRGQIPFDSGELDFLPSIGNALCRFIDALYPYGVKPGAK